MMEKKMIPVLLVISRRHSYLGGVSPEEFETAAKRDRKRVH